MKNSDLPPFEDALLKLAAVKADLGLFSEARQLLEEALTLQPQPDGSGPASATMATILGNLGVVDFRQGEYAGARSYFERELAIHRQLKTDVTGDGFGSFCHLATCLSFLGDHVGASRLMREALPYLQRSLGKNDAVSPLHYLQAGALLMDMGSVEESAVYKEEALRRLLRQLGEHHPHTARALQAMGQLRRHQGLYTEARPLFDRALAAWHKMDGYEHEKAVTINSLGQIYEALDDHEEALRRYREALTLRRSVLEPEPRLVAESLNNIAGVLRLLGRLEEAIETYKELLRLPEKALVANHRLMPAVYAGLGSALSRQGQHKEALQFHLKSLNLIREVIGDAEQNLGDAEKGVGLQLLLMDRVHEALPYLQRAVVLQKAAYGLSHSQTEDALLCLALAEAAGGHEQRAFDLAVEAGGVSSRRLGQSFGLSSEKQRDRQVSGADTILRVMIHLAIQIREHTGAPVPTVEQAAFQQVLRFKGIRAELLVLQMESLVSSQPELAPQVQALATVRARMAHLALAVSSGQVTGSISSVGRALTELAAQREEIEAGLAGQVRELAELRRLQSCDLATVSAALPSGGVLVEYLRTPCLNFQELFHRQAHDQSSDRYVAFVLPAARPALACLIDLGDAAHIDDLVSRCRNVFDRPPLERPSDVHDPRPELRQAVFDPLLPALCGDTRLLVAPDVSLALFPLEVLSSPSGRLLLQDYQISYLTCGRDLLRFQAGRPGHPSAPIVVAAPDFDLQTPARTFRRAVTTPASSSCWTEDVRGSGRFFAPLSGTEAEAKAVAALLDIRPWLGAEALKEPLKRLHSPRILHLATHGIHLPHPRLIKTGELVRIRSIASGQDTVSYLENALYRSALALAGANTWLRRQPTPSEAGNGLLTAEEVCSLNLLDTELVVLSACVTGMGDLKIGEGVLGLRSAFTVAGARAIVTSLWEVDDYATRELMIEFYRQLRTPQPADAALRAAQEAVRQRWPDPYFWGAFICQGDPALVQRLVA